MNEWHLIALAIVFVLLVNLRDVKRYFQIRSM